VITHAFQSAKANSGDPTIVSSTYWNNTHRLKVTAEAAGRAITAADGVLLVTTGGSNKTFTLPAVASNQFLFLQVIKVDAGAGIVILTPNSGDTFKLGTDWRLVEQDQMVLFTNDGVSDWRPLGTN
jgi:hypothetical protein